MNKNNDPDFDDDLPPELEDIPEDAIPKKSTKANVAGSGNVSLGDYAQAKPEVENTQTVQVPQKEEKKKPEAFAGIKKGFFNAESKPKAPSQPKKEVKQDIIEVKPTQKKDSKVLDEVQEAMKMNQTLLDKKSDWMTQDLLTKFATNPRLTKLFTNPEYMQAIGIMQKNPQEAMRKYGHNPEFKELLLEFSKVMGEHFEEMGKKAPPQTTGGTGAAPPRDPKAEEYLNDPKVKSLIMYLQQNPKLDFQRVMMQDPDLAQKIKYLIDKGFFQLHAG